MAMLRPNGLHTTLASMLALGLLAGCAVRPTPLTERDTAKRVAEDRRALAANRPALDGPLTLHRAMAYALLYNLDSRVRAMEQALALGELEADRLGLLPGLSARYGATTRSSVRASSSRSVRTGLESLSASTSSDRTTRTGNLTTVWHALDFGVSWYAARQQSDRVLIAHERRRKAVQTVLAEVRRAWWRAAAAERALGKVGSLTDRVKAALADSARIAELRVRSPLEALRYRRALLRALEVLEQQQREGRRTRLELAELIGLGPGLAYRLTLPPEPLPAPRQPVLDTASLETLALRQRPELREAQLSGRIAAAEVRKALLRVLPGLELSAGAHTDSNSFLLNDNWAVLGAQVSVNLKQLFAAPVAMGAARAGQALERARREALAMAVLTQLHLALAGFEEARAQYATARRIADTQDGIAAALRSGARLGVMDELEAVLAELEAVRTGLARDLAFAKIEEGFGRIFATAGADIVPDGSAAMIPGDLAAVIAVAEAAWMRGEVSMLPFPESRAE